MIGLPLVCQGELFSSVDFSVIAKFSHICMLVREKLFNKSIAKLSDLKGTDFLCVLKFKYLKVSSKFTLFKLQYLYLTKCCFQSGPFSVCLDSDTSIRENVG